MAVGMKTEKKVFYGITSKYACGVYDDLDKLRESRKYVPGSRVKKCSTFSEAKDWSENGYLEYQTGYYGSYKVPDIKKMNWIYRLG